MKMNYAREIQSKCGYSHCFQKDLKVKGYCSKECKTKQEGLSKRQIIKDECLSYLGGKCKRCGFNELSSILHFHHLDPYDKKFEISSYLSRGLKWLKPELDKCVLLCKNCHDVVHATKDPEYFNLNRYCFGTSSITFETVDYYKATEKCTEDLIEQMDGSIYNNPNKNHIIPSDMIIHS